MLGDEGPENKNEGAGRNIFLLLLLSAAATFFYQKQDLFWDIVNRFNAMFDLFK